MNIDFSLITLIPADESHRELSYRVKKEAEGSYIAEIWGWDENLQRDYHTRDWEDARPEIIQYNDISIGTISIRETDEYTKIGQFFILPEYQNRGIGSHLLKDILNKADKADRVIRLTFMKNNPVASLYLRNGFRIVASDEYFYFMERLPVNRANKEKL